jgi:hypothetical protein
VECCAVSIQDKIWKGNGRAASVLGQSYEFYRPSAGLTPLVWRDPHTGLLNNPIVTLKVALNAEDMKFSRPNKYGKPTWYALFDGKDVKSGDYLVGPQGTFFIAAMQYLLPILAVECNRVVTLSRPAERTGVDDTSYSGMQNEVAYVTGVPCSILQGTKGEKGDTSLPSDTKMPWWSILLPAAGDLKFGDLATDDLGRRYVLSSTELTDLGYRLTAMLAMS